MGAENRPHYFQNKMPHRVRYNLKDYNNLNRLINIKDELEEELYLEDDLYKRLDLMAEIEDMERRIRNMRRFHG